MRATSFEISKTDKLIGSLTCLKNSFYQNILNSRLSENMNSSENNDNIIIFSQHFLIFKATAFGILIFLNVCLNTLTLVVLRKMKELKPTTRVLLTSMTVGDIVSLIYHIYQHYREWLAFWDQLLHPPWICRFTCECPVSCQFTGCERRTLYSGRLPV